MFENMTNTAASMSVGKPHIIHLRDHCKCPTERTIELASRVPKKKNLRILYCLTPSASMLPKAPASRLPGYGLRLQRIYVTFISECDE